MIDPVDFARCLDAIVERAPRLRDGGVREVSIEGVSFRLAEPPLPVTEQPLQQSTRRDVANDPATYGLKEGDRIPGIDWADPDMLRKQQQREADETRRSRGGPRG